MDQLTCNGHAEIAQTRWNDITVLFDIELPKVGTWQGYIGKTRAMMCIRPRVVHMAQYHIEEKEIKIIDILAYYKLQNCHTEGKHKAADATWR